MKTLLLLISLSLSAFASTVTLTMDEVAFQPINNLAVTKGGITFTFSDSGGTVFYDASNGGTMTYVQDPSIEGLIEPIGVSFSVPVYSVQFGMAVDIFSTGFSMGTVTLYNGATQIYSGNVNATLADIFSEGQFTYSSNAPITRMTLVPSNGNRATAFAIDNLTVNTAPSTPSVPTLSDAALVLLSLVLLGSGCWIARKHRPDSR